MGDYKQNMADEKRPPTILPEGHRVVRVTEMIPGVSKNGNQMFTATIEDVKTRKSMQVWCVAEPKKRWLLKSLLTACGVAAGQDGVYDWSVTDVIGQTVVALVEHSQEPWINKDGVEIMQTKAKVTEFLTPVKGADVKISEEDVEWQE